MRVFQFFLCVLTLCRYLQIHGTLAVTCIENDIRLTQTATIKSPDNNVGRVELCRNRKWGTITLDLDPKVQFWSQKNVQVACRQLGFSGGLNSIPSSNINITEKSPSNLAIHFDEVICKGQEQSLTGCTFSERSNSPNDIAPSAHHNDVFIVCRPTNVSYSDLHLAGEHLGDLRLFGDVKDGVGAVEIYTDQGWTGICPDSSWTGLEVSSICKDLGYDFGAKQIFEVRSGNVRRLVYDARCVSDPRDVGDASRVDAAICSFQKIKSPENCSFPQYMFAGVACENSIGSGIDSTRLFMIEDTNPGRAVGVVEVFLGDRWGVVCGDDAGNVSQVTAQILCTRFSFSMDDYRSIHISSSILTSYESNLKPLWVDKITCPNNATSMAECVHEEPLGFSNCSSRHILALDCGSTLVHSDGNTSSIIIGVMVMVFVFCVVFVIFGRIMCSMFRKRERMRTGFLSNLTETTQTSATQNIYVDSPEDTKLFGGNEVKQRDQHTVGNRRHTGGRVEKV